MHCDKILIHLKEFEFDNNYNNKQQRWKSMICRKVNKIFG
jgi:hypothetical protein